MNKMIDFSSIDVNENMMVSLDDYSNLIMHR